MIMSSFLDAHTHLFSGAVDGSRYVCSDLGKGRSQAECVKIIKEFAEAHPDYKRIRGSGWFITNWGDEPLPDKRLLDEAIPDQAGISFLCRLPQHVAEFQSAGRGGDRSQTEKWITV